MSRYKLVEGMGVDDIDLQVDYCCFVGHDVVDFRLTWFCISRCFKGVKF